MPAAVGERALVWRRADGWLVGWLAVAVWVAAWVMHHYGIHAGINAVGALYWIGAVITAMHFGLSYHLAYSGGPSSLRARPFPLVVAPAALALLLCGVVVVSLHTGTATTAHVTSALITLVYLTTTWHYIKQVYGVGRIGAAYANVSLTGSDVRILRFGLYPLWFLGAAQVLVRGANYGLSGFAVGFGVLPGPTLLLLRVLALCSAVPVLIVFARIRMRTGVAAPALLVAPYVAAFLWLGIPVNQTLTILALAPFHALQYLAVGHRAEVAVASTRPGRHGGAWWLNVFAGAACGGLLLGRWLPSLLDNHFGHSGEPLLFAAVFFVFLNLHHYLIDASIWRSKGELVRAMVRKPAAEPAAVPVAKGFADARG